MKLQLIIDDHEVELSPLIEGALAEAVESFRKKAERRAKLNPKKDPPKVEIRP